MQYRPLGKTGWRISEVSLGTWQVGGRWGEPFDQARARQILNTAIDAGVNFIDTADVYGDRLSEAVVGEVVRQRDERIYVATKIGRRLDPHTPEGYNRANLTRFVDEALTNTDLDCLDLVQLHCPPTPVYENGEVFAVLDDLKAAGKIRHYGVSVETVAEAERAIQWPGVATVQIIFNLMRYKPADTFLKAAHAAGVGILARVPLASGLLTGKFGADTQFDPGDHRHFNREGKAFDKGETFSGVPYDLALQVVAEIKAVMGDRPLAQAALRWILMFEAVSCVIPGASRPAQVTDNIAAAELAPFSPEEMQALRAIYDRHLRPIIHPQW
ncbi:MAG: aldo/keto reductase [Bacteroidetes bacterium]|nr:MAG: aldo/keto reductase [Bacteroidota bacterium]